MVYGRVDHGSFQRIGCPFVAMDTSVDQLCVHGDGADFEVFAGGSESGMGLRVGNWMAGRAHVCSRLRVGRGGHPTERAVGTDQGCWRDKGGRYGHALGMGKGA